MIIEVIIEVDMQDDFDKFITKSGLKNQRGWTDGLISRFASEPDRTADNPHYRKAAPMQLYLISRIEEIEQTEEFREALVAAEKRRTASVKAAKTKRQTTLKRIEECTPAILTEPLPVVRRRAIKEYNVRSDFSASESSDLDFLNRITVNYLRHNMTDYELTLEKNRGKVGTQEAYINVRKKVLDAIAAAYPELRDECTRQYNRKVIQMVECEAMR